MSNAKSDTGALRLDKWLTYARFVKHRSVALDLIKRRRVRLNDRLIDKPHSLVRPGDVLTLVTARDVMVLRVRGLADRRGPATQARQLYEQIEA